MSDEEIFVNAQDGLNLEAMDEVNITRRRLQEIGVDLNLVQGQLANLSLEDLVNDTQFPTTLIVTGFCEEFFEDEALKKRMEGLFKVYGQDAQFYYFRSFKRVRVSYESAASAIHARVKMHMNSLGNNTLKCYFGQPIVSSIVLYFSISKY